MPLTKKPARAGRKRHSKLPLTQPEPNFGAALVNVLDGRWEIFLAQLRRNRRQCTEPSIHDLRVATRRMIATLDAVAAVLPGGAPEGVRRKLKRLLKGFNDLRDVHIQILHLHALRLRFPVLRPFLAALRVREQQLVRKAAAAIERLKTRPMEREIARAAESLAVAVTGPEAEQASRAALFGALAAAFTRAAGLRRRIAPGDPASIHALRVAFKKFRYTVEVLAPHLPAFGKKHLKAMNAYQTRMGEIQDLVVVGTALTMNLPGRFRTMPASLLPVHQFITQLRTELIERFVRDVDELLTFWQHISWSPYGTLHTSSRRSRSAWNQRVPQR